MALTTKQRDFIDAYCGSAQGHITKAAIAAGYAERSAYSIGSENLKKPEIQAEIAARTAQIMPKVELLQRLAARGRATIADVLRMPEPKKRDDGTEYTVVDDWAIDLVKAAETGGIHQIKKLKETRWGSEAEMHDPLPALELLAKQSGLLKDDGGILKYLDLSKLSPAQLQRLADGDDPLAVLLGTTADPGESPA
jgi:Phage terminase, small subunit